MALVVGNKAVVTLNDIALSLYVTHISIDLKGKTLIDITAMGATGKAWASDKLNDVSFTIDFLFDKEALGSWAVLEQLWDSDVAFNFVIKFHVDESHEISGTCMMETLPVTIALGDMIRIPGVAFKVIGSPTVTP